MTKRIRAAAKTEPQSEILAWLADVEIKAAEGESKGPARFDMVAYNGGELRVPGFNLPVVVDLAGAEFHKSVVANLDHDRTQRVGHVTDKVNDGKTVKLGGFVSGAGSAAKEVLAAHANQYPWQASIEANRLKLDLIRANKSVDVNGQTFTGPIYVARKSVIYAVAFCDQGADSDTVVNIAAQAAHSKEISMNPELKAWISSMGFDPDSLTEEQVTGLKANYEGRSATRTNKEQSTPDDMFAAERAEVQRKEDIRKIAASAIQGNSTIEYVDAVDALAKHHIAAKSPVTAFELDLLRRSRPQAVPPSTPVHNIDARVIEAAMCKASGLPNWEKGYSEQTLDAVDRNKMGSFGIQQMLIHAAMAHGYTCRPGERITSANLREVLEYAFPPAHVRIAAASPFSTVSLPNVLGNVANKSILQGYMESDNTWREIAEIKPVSNFYTQNHYRILDSLEYEEVGSGGELKHGTLGEETYTSQAKTYGKLLGLTRTQIINDDLSAFADIRARLGRGAAKKFSNVFWTAFINNSSFYTAALTNYISGSTTNLGTDGVGLGLAVAGFRGMTTPTADGSKRVGQDINPSKIIVPPELESNALMVYKNENLGAVAMGTGANIFQGRFRPVVQWRLSNSSYTGYSTTAFYMFGDEVKPMLVTFLNGQEAPTVESTDVDFDKLGIAFRGYHDFGCDKSEYLAGIKSKGAA